MLEDIEEGATDPIDVFHAHETKKGPPPAEDKAELDRTRKREARGLLIRILRQAPKLYLVLGCGQHATDRELLQALLDAEDPRTTLLKAGCSMADAAKVLHNLKDAIASEEKATHAGWSSKTLSGRVWTALFLLGASVVLLTAMICVVALGKAGWEVGRCKIAGYHNISYGESCLNMVDCKFDMEVRFQAKIMRMNNWEPALERAGEVVSISGDPFRCCNLGGKMHCCDFFDQKQQYFCDNWPHRNDARGQYCPEGAWSCLFKLAPGTVGQVSEVQPNVDDPMIMRLLWSSVVLLIVSAIVAVWPWMTKYTWLCISKIMIALNIMKPGELTILKDAATRRKAEEDRTDHRTKKPHHHVEKYDAEFKKNEAMNRRRHSQANLDSAEVEQVQNLEEADHHKEFVDNPDDDTFVEDTWQLEDKKFRDLKGEKGEHHETKHQTTDEAVDDAHKGPIFSIKELAAQASYEWQIPIIQPYALPPSRQSSRAGSAAGRLGRSRSMGDVESLSARSHSTMGSARPRSVGAWTSDEKPRSVGLGTPGRRRPGSAKSNASHADPVENWNWGDQGIDGYAIEDLGEVGGKPHSLRITAGNQLAWSAPPSSASNAHHPPSGTGNSPGMSRPPFHPAASARPGSQQNSARPGSQPSSARPGSQPGSARPGSGKRARPGSGRTLSAHARRNNVVSAPPSWADYSA